jgi:hypothetical protein
VDPVAIRATQNDPSSIPLINGIDSRELRFQQIRLAR